MNNQSRFLVLIYSLLFLSRIGNVDCYIGINWGRVATQRILPSMAIDLLLQNGIPDVKIFSTEESVLKAFYGTNLKVTVTIQNSDLKNINSVDDAKMWIKSTLTKHLQMGVHLRYIAVGTWPFSRTNFNRTYFHAVEVLDYMQRAIDDLLPPGNGVKATLDHYVDVINNANKPSEAEFMEEVRDAMIRSTEILVKNNAPICLDMFPLYKAQTLFNDTEFAFFENNSTSHFVDESYTYKNIFQVSYDRFAVALEKAGFPDIKIVVSQVGWPTDGSLDANIGNAERFNGGLVKHIMSGKGTPRRPGPIDAYIHNLADENQLPIISRSEQGGFMRHWGIYRFDGTPKYRIDFSGQGRDIYPFSGTGITYMPKRWCVFNKQRRNATELKGLIYNACGAADCSALEPGGSCSNISWVDQISYAFNVYFQEGSQKFSNLTCFFNGLGEITPNDPSVGNCTFPVEIVTSDYMGDNNGSHSLISAHTMPIFFMLLLFWIFGYGQM